MQTHVNAPLPVRLAAMPGATAEVRAWHALGAIRQRVAAQLAAEDREAATVELYRLANGPAIPEFTLTVEVPAASLGIAIAVRRRDHR